MDHSGVAHKIKECLGNVVNDRSKDDMATQHPDKSGKWSVKMKMFYNQHFPTDKDSYAVRLSVVALALSLCSIQIFVNLQWNEYKQRREYYDWAVIVLISAATYGLYYGIKIGDRKQFTPWITFKIIEIITTAIAVLGTVTGSHLNGNRLVNVLIGFLVLGGNLILLSIICHRKKDNLDDVPETIDEFYPVIRTV